jgi:two-component system cell cycle response regulator DivK
VIRKRVLLVEDEEHILHLLTDLLTITLDQEVLTATDGIEAIRMAQEHRPDLILMNLTLPKLDGWEATRSLKANDELRHIPILAITAHTMVGDRERALEVRRLFRQTHRCRCLCRVLAALFAGLKSHRRRIWL